MVLCRTCASLLKRTPLNASPTPELHLFFIDKLSNSSSAVSITRRLSSHQSGSNVRELNRDNDSSDSLSSPSTSSTSSTLPSTSLRPKSFKELAAMKDRELKKEKTIWEMTVSEGLAAARDQVENKRVSSEPLKPSSSTSTMRTTMTTTATTPNPASNFFYHFKENYNFLRRSFRYWARLGQEVGDVFEEKLKKDFPAHHNKLLKQDADLAKRLNEANLIMFATNKEMLFYGHPFRGAAIISSLSPFVLIGALGSYAGLGLAIYAFGYWNFYLTKLTRAVWYDAEKDLYTIFLPFNFKQRLLMTFKAGHVTEVDDLFANVKIRKTKAFCPPELFKSDQDYKKMFKLEKRWKKKSPHMDEC